MLGLKLLNQLQLIVNYLHQQPHLNLSILIIGKVIQLTLRPNIGIRRLTGRKFFERVSFLTISKRFLCCTVSHVMKTQQLFDI